MAVWTIYPDYDGLLQYANGATIDEVWDATAASGVADTATFEFLGLTFSSTKYYGYQLGFVFDCDGITNGHTTDSVDFELDIRNNWVTESTYWRMVKAPITDPLSSNTDQY